MKAEGTGEDAIKAVEKVLGTPFGLEYQEHALKTRRNLVIAGAVAVIFYLAGLKIESPSSTTHPTIPLIFGLAVSGLSQKVFLSALLCALGYLICHFMWTSIEALYEFRLRSTGTTLAHKTGMMWTSVNADYPDDPRQSTLYTWWLQRRDDLPSADAISQTKSDLQQLSSKADALTNSAGTQEHQELISSVRRAEAALTKVEQALVVQQAIQSDPRIPTALKRFDQAFQNHAISQNLRWFIFDFGIPVVLGATGFAMITIKLCNS